jgi:hypothetical protein
MIIFNKYTLIGIFLIIVGIPLTVIWIGFPLMMIGFLIGDYGIIYYIVKKVPGLDKKIGKFFLMIKKSYEPYFRKEVAKK